MTQIGDTFSALGDILDAPRYRYVHSYSCSYKLIDLLSCNSLMSTFIRQRQ